MSAILDALQELSVPEASRRIAEWRPSAEDTWNLITSHSLAGVLAELVAAKPDDWSEDPVRVVETLREPVYLLRYFETLRSAKAEVIRNRGIAIVDAAATARRERWSVAQQDNDQEDRERNWKEVDLDAVDLAANVASRGCDLGSRLAEVRQWAEELVDLEVDEGPEHPADDVTDPLFHAINSSRGRGLRALLWLAHAEQRYTGATSADFETLLTSVLGVPGAAGSEYRAILAQHYALLAAIVPDWLTDNATVLFSDDSLGQPTFDLALKYAQLPKEFLATFEHRVISAARRGAAQAAAWCAAALINEIFAVDAVAAGLNGAAEQLNEVCDQIAFRAQSAEPDSPWLERTIALWRSFISADRSTVPPEALRSVSRWAFVDALDDQRWTDLTLQTLRITGGKLDDTMQVADKCAAAEVTPTTLESLYLMLNADEDWERYHVAHQGRRALTENAAAIGTPEGRRLHRRLLDLGVY